MFADLTQLTTRHLEVFRTGDFPAARRMDREVEVAIGAKERAIGALSQHMIEHKCRGERANLEMDSH